MATKKTSIRLDIKLADEAVQVLGVKSRTEAVHQALREIVVTETLEKSESISWREVASRRGSIPASILRGARDKADITRVQLSELTGILQQHIYEMEQGKRPISKISARKLAAALNIDYRLLL